MAFQYPINLNLRGRPCLVVGGGGVGTRKARGLVDCGADVTVVALKATDRLCKMAENRTLRLKEREFHPRDVAGMYLVMAATNDRALNRRIYQTASDRGILCNIADQPDLCSFTLPAVVRRGDLLLTVSTSGASPALAKKLRRDLELQFGEAYAVLLKLMGAIRKRELPETYKDIFEKLMAGGLLEMIKTGDFKKIDAILAKTLGKECSYQLLMENGRTSQKTHGDLP